MDSVKADNERELTSTMGNVLSMSSKDEKNDTSDATPTSSTDANTTSTASIIVSDDPISSTSSDIIEQNKSTSVEATMQNNVEVSQTVVDEPDKSSSADPEADLLEMSISNVSNEKITEDVEDLVHDLESLLGESTDSFNVTIKRKEDHKSPESREMCDESQTSVMKGEELSEDNSVSGNSGEGNQDGDTKSDENVPDKNISNAVSDEAQEIELQPDRSEHSTVSDEANIKENNEESNRQIEDQSPSLDKGIQQTHLSSDVAEPQSSSESKYVEVLEESGILSEGEGKIEKVTEDTVAESELSKECTKTIDTKEKSDDLTKESEKCTQDVEKTTEEEAKVSKAVTESVVTEEQLVNRESRIQEGNRSKVEENELNTEATELIMVPKDKNDIDSNETCSREEPEETVEKKHDIPEGIESSTENIEAVEHPKEETECTTTNLEYIALKDTAEDKPNDAEVVECLEDIKVNENVRVLEGGPSGDHQSKSEKSELKTDEEVPNVSESENILGDSKTENFKNTESFEETIASKKSFKDKEEQLEQTPEELTGTDESLTNIAEAKDVRDLDQDTESSTSIAEEQKSVDGLKEETMSSKISSDTPKLPETLEKKGMPSEMEEETDTEAYMFSAQQQRVTECEQVDGTNTETEEIRSQTETNSNIETHECETNSVCETQTSEYKIEESAESTIEVCSPSIKGGLNEINLPENEILEQEMSNNQCESPVNIPESTVNIMLEKSDIKTNNAESIDDPSESAAESVTRTTSETEALLIPNETTIGEIPNPQRLEQPVIYNPGTTSKSEASPTPDQETIGEAPNPQLLEQVAASDSESTSKSEALPMLDHVTVGEDPNSHLVEQTVTSDHRTTSESEALPTPYQVTVGEAPSPPPLKQTTTSDSGTTSKFETSPTPDQETVGETPSPHPLEQAITSDPGTISKSDASPTPDQVDVNEAPSHNSLEQAVTSDSVKLTITSDSELETSGGSFLGPNASKSPDGSRFADTTNDVVLINENESAHTVLESEKIEENSENLPKEVEQLQSPHEIVEQQLGHKLAKDENEVASTSVAEASNIETNITLKDMEKKFVVTDTETGIVEDSSEITGIVFQSEDKEIMVQRLTQPESTTEVTAEMDAEVISEITIEREVIEVAHTVAENYDKHEVSTVLGHMESEEESTECLEIDQSMETETIPVLSDDVDIQNPSSVDDNFRQAECSPESEIPNTVGEILAPNEDNSADNSDKMIASTKSEHDEFEISTEAEVANIIEITSTEGTCNPTDKSPIPVDKTSTSSNNTAIPVDEIPVSTDDIPDQINVTPEVNEKCPTPVDETGNPGDESSTSVDDIDNVHNAISISANETLSPNTASPEIVDEVSNPVEGTCSLHDVMRNPVNESTGTDEKISRPMDETLNLVADTAQPSAEVCNPVDETLNLNKNIPAQTDEASKLMEEIYNSGISKPVDGTVNQNNGSPRLIEETSSLEGEISNPVVESPNPDDQIPSSVDDNFIQTECNADSEIHNTVSETLTPNEDNSVLINETRNPIGDTFNPDDEVPNPVNKTLNPDEEVPQVNKEICNIEDVVASTSDEHTLNPNDAISGPFHNTPGQIESNPDKGISDSVNENLNPDEIVASVTNETPDPIGETSDLDDRVPKPEDETLNLIDGIPSQSDEVLKSTEEISNPNDGSEAGESLNPGDEIAKPVMLVSETSEKINPYDKTAQVVDTPNPNLESVEEIPIPSEGAPNTVNETVSCDETTEPMEEAVNSNGRTSTIISENVTSDDGIPYSVESVVEIADSDEEIPNTVNETVNPDGGITQPVDLDETIGPVDKTAEPMEQTADDGIPVVVHETLNLDDEMPQSVDEGIRKSLEEIPHTNYDIVKPVEETSKPDDGVPNLTNRTSDPSSDISRSVDEAPDSSNEVSSQSGETPSLNNEHVTSGNEACTLANKMPHSNGASKSSDGIHAPNEIFQTTAETNEQANEVSTAAIPELVDDNSQLDEGTTKSDNDIPRPEPKCNNEIRVDQNSEIITLPDSNTTEIEDSVDFIEEAKEQALNDEEIDGSKKDNDKVVEISDDDSKPMEGGEYIQISSGPDSDLEEMVPILALESDDNNLSSEQPNKNESETETSCLEVHSMDVAGVAETLPEIEEILADQGQVDEGVNSIDMQENLETILAVASLQNADSTEDEIVEPQISEKERREMEALRKAVESITEDPTAEFEDVDNVGELIPVENAEVESEIVAETQDLQKVELDLVEDNVEVAVVNEADKVEDLDNEENRSEVVPGRIESDGEIADQDVPELRLEDSTDEVEEFVNKEKTGEVRAEDVEENPQSLPDTSEDKILENKMEHLEATRVLPDSSQVVSASEESKPSESPKECKARPRRHKKSSSGDGKLEELSINVDVPDKEIPYSPKVTIKPIKVPDDEVSTTSNSDTEIGKGSLKMTITKQSDKMHSILKICDPESSEAAQEQEEPIPKLIIKPKIQHIEQQHSPKMATRSSKQVYSPTSSTQRSCSPRVTIKSVKAEKSDIVSPLKIKLKPEETSKKHSPKLNIKHVTKPEEETPKENVQAARKVIIKPVIKPTEDVEQIHSPRITIKPIPKPETDKESTPTTPRLNIKPVKKQDDEETEQEKERSSPKITIKPVKHPEPDTQSPTDDDEGKGRIIIKINKGNLPTPTKESKKREHPPEDDKSEKLAKITVKFSKGGGHPHIVQQPEESSKRPHEEQASPEKVKKQKIEFESPISTRSKHKESMVELSVETRSKHKEITADNPGSEPTKSKQKESESPIHEVAKATKHKDSISESPVESKRAKLKETVSDTPIYESTRSRHKDTSSETSVSDATRSKQKEHIVAETKVTVSTDNPGNVKVTVVETKIESPIVISEDSRSQDGGSRAMAEDPKDPLAAIPVFEIRAEPIKAMTPKQETVTSTPTTPSMPTPTPTPTTPMPRKRGRPRKVPIVVREEFKEQEEPKPEPPKTEEPPQESGRPKRSCRGQSVRTTLGIKPRKPRGPGRGRGSKRGMGTRSVPMKPEREPKLSKAKLKLMQESIQEEIVKAVELEKDKKQTTEVVIADVEIKAPAPVLAPPESSEVPASLSIGLPVPSPQAPIASPASLPGASPKPAISLSTTEPSIVDSVTPSTSSRVSGEIVMVDEETRMSADTNSRAQTPAKQVVPSDAVIEESQSSVQSSATTESGKAASSRPNKAPRLEVQEPEGAVISADQLTEYYWNGNGPFMLQEQVAQFLGIKSFKRKYPGIMRRMLDMQERDFIRESGLASENMCDLGLTAVNSADILDIMYSDFQDKYEEYCKHQRDRQAKDLINKQKALSLAASQEKNKADITEQAVQSAAQWNASFNKTRREQRKACMDLQTLTVHYPKGKMKQINKAKVGNYPVALVPGQYTDYYKEFTPTEINNLPINTMCYDPINIIPPEESDDSGSDGSDSDSDSSSSSSESGSDSSSGVEDCKLCKHSPKKAPTSK